MSREIAVKPLTEDDARAFVETIKKRIGDIREMLIELYDRRGWEVLGYDNWDAFVEEEIGWSKRYANMQLSAGKIEQKLLTTAKPQVGTMVPTPPPTSPIPERQLRPLASLPEDQQVAAYMDAKEEAEKAGKPLTAKDVKAKADAYKADNEPYVAPPEEPEEPEEEAPEPTVEESMAASNKALESLARQITGLHKTAEGLEEPHLAERLDTLLGQLKAAAGTVRASKGYATCSYCDGVGGGCNPCRESGWLTKTASESAPRD